MNIELNFPPKLRGARSRLYRRRFLQVNTRWKALAEIYTMHSFAPFSNLKMFVQFRTKIAEVSANFADLFYILSTSAKFCKMFGKFLPDFPPNCAWYQY